MPREPTRYEQDEGLLPPERSMDRVPISIWMRYRDNRAAETRGMPLGGAGGCWCGEPQGHPWMGKGEGAPHPR